MKILQPPGWATPKGYANGVAARGTLVFVGGREGLHNPVPPKRELMGEYSHGETSAEFAQIGRSAQPRPKRELMREYSHGETSAEFAAYFRHF
jgi:hypothetical protein